MGLYGDRENKLVTAGDDQMRAKLAIEFNEPWILRALVALKIFSARGLEMKAQCGDRVARKAGGRARYGSGHGHYRGIVGGKARCELILAKALL